MVGVGVGVDCGSGGPALRSVKECTAPRLLWHATIKQWTRGHQSLLVLSLTHATSTGYPWYCGGTSIIGVSRDRHSTSAKKFGSETETDHPQFDKKRFGRSHNFTSAFAQF